ncbi:MAG: bacteriohemerythrin [Alphaproteobacteria bacterium]|nr:bacteriohemerythrin [Alphaproteobacteria bacterium]MDP6567213.1 bacteriohemerythrin [Alphaproteobacteria bacterium]MDP6813464.1 bacteriohemerythrin [Alphaproteobacteria bacterium]
MTQILLEWDDKYLIGVEELDYEHVDLFNRVNQIFEQLAGQSEPAAVEDILEALFTRVEAHFALEERFMREHKYTGYDPHKEEHDLFLDNLREAIERFRLGPAVSSSETMMAELKLWVIDHVLTSDQDLGGVQG